MKKFKIKFILIFICLFALFIPKVNAQVEDVSNPDEGYTHTFVFYNGGEVWETSILKNDEVLTQPANPSRENQVFVGWYKDSNFTEVFDGFNQPATLDDGTTNVYAKFKQVFYITYLDVNNNVILTEKLDENASYTINSNSPVFVFNNPRQKNNGWKDQNNIEYIGNRNITVNEDLTLTPILMDGVFVRYFTDGGTPIESEFIPLNEKATKPADPTKKGYTFDGWYKDSNYNTEFDFNSALTDNQDVYAKWEPAEVKYTIAYWRENADDDDYHFFESDTQTTLTGTTIDEAYLRGKGLIENNRYLHFYYDSSETKEVNGDETTVINVYYKTYRHTLNFVGKTKEGVTKRYTVNDVKYLQNTNRICNIIADINYDINVYFTFKTDSGTTAIATYREGGVFSNFTLTGTSSKTFNFTQNKWSIITYRYTYYELTDDEQAPDGADVRVFDGIKFYQRSLPVAHVGMTRYTTYLGETVGYTAYAAVDANGRIYYYPQHLSFAAITGKNYIYALKHKFDIKYLTNIGETIDPVENVYYNYLVEPYITNEYTEDVTLKTIDGITYIFKGWYTDQSFIEKADFSTMLMPDHDLLLFAKWEALKSKVTFDPNFGNNSGTFNSDTEVVVNTGNKVEEPVKPIKNTNSDDNFRYVFLGWELNGKPYDFSSPVTEDITLKAMWGIEPIPTYKVTYNLGNGTGNVKDDNKYLMSSKARVLLGSITAPLNSYFVYWIDEDNEIYYPNDLVNVIDKDVKLTAVYHKREKTSLIYNLNYSTFGITNNGVNELDKDSAKNLLINSIIILRDPMGNEIPEGYTFGGWYLDKECTGDSITRVIIDNNNPLPNMIYAKWIPIPEEGTGSTDGSKEVIETVARTVLNPNTGDNISLYIMLFILSIIGMSSTVLIKK